MNLKSNILKISVVIALIFILIPVIAAEDVDDSVYTADIDDSVTEAIDDTVYTDDLTYGTDDEVGESLDDNLADTQDGIQDDTPDVVVGDGTDDETTEDQDENTDENLDIATDENADELDVQANGDQSADLQIFIVAPKKVHVGDTALITHVVYNKGPDTAYNVLVRSVLIGTIDINKAIPSKGYFIVEKGILYWYIDALAPGELATLSVIGEILSEEDILIMASVSSDTPDPDLDNNLAFLIIENGGEVEAASEVMPATGNPMALALLALLSVVGISIRKRF